MNGINWQITRLESVSSTNTYLLEQARSGAPHGTVVTAERQTAGRGRRGRSFISPEGGLYMSVLLRELPYGSDCAVITAAAAVAFRSALQRFCGEQIGIKWVNDLMIGEKKLAGILAEGVVECNCIKGVVVGIGVNLTAPPPEVADIACSLEGAAAAQQAADALLEELEKVLGMPQEQVMEQYRAHSIAIGRRVTVVRPNGEIEADAIDTDDRAHLICRTDSGELLTLDSGEIRIRL